MKGSLDTKVRRDGSPATQLLAFLFGLLTLILLTAFPLQIENPVGRYEGNVGRIHKSVNANPGDLEALPLRRGVARYLEGGFRMDTLGQCGDWQNWIVVDDGSDWTIGKLRMVRSAILHTISALDGVGLDGPALLAGYRFRLANAQFVDDLPGRQAQVDHRLQLITLGDSAFGAHQGFFIYHELGHIVDHRLGRSLTALFEDETLLANVSGNNTGHISGIWMREQAQAKPSEAAADAFALWVLVDQAGYSIPTFPSADVNVDAPVLFTLTEDSLGALDPNDSSICAGYESLP